MKAVEISLTLNACHFALLLNFLHFYSQQPALMTVGFLTFRLIEMGLVEAIDSALTVGALDDQI